MRPRDAAIAVAFSTAFLAACSPHPQGRVCRAARTTNSPCRHAYDLNGDGFADTVAAGFDGVHVFFGSAHGIGPTDSQTITAPLDSIRGARLAPLDDVNGDGFADLVVIPPQGTEMPSGGRVLEYFGSPHGLAQTPVEMQIENVAIDSWWAGRVVELADFDGDSFADLAVQTASGPTASALFRVEVFRGSPSGLDRTAWANVTERNGGGERGPLWSIAGAADFDGDGYEDLVVMALTDIAPRAVVFRGGPAQLTEAVSFAIAPARNRVVWVAGDVNGDRYPDVVTMSPTPGTIDVFFGGPSGLPTTRSQSVEPAPGAAFTGVVATGDLDANGLGDVLAATSTNGIRAFVMLRGSRLGLVRATDWSLSDPAMGSDGVGIEARDFDGDGFGDTVLGWQTSDGITRTGFAALLRGSATGPGMPDAPFTVPDTWFQGMTQ